MFAGLVEYPPSGFESSSPWFSYYFAKQNNRSFIRRGPIDIRYPSKKKNVYFFFLLYKILRINCLTNLMSFCKANRGKVPFRLGECPLNLGRSALFLDCPPCPLGLPARLPSALHTCSYRCGIIYGI